MRSINPICEVLLENDWKSIKKNSSVVGNIKHPAIRVDRLPRGLESAWAGKRSSIYVERDPIGSFLMVASHYKVERLEILAFVDFCLQLRTSDYVAY